MTRWQANEESVDRILAFSDGVVAIAITLLLTVGALVVALVISLFSPSAGIWALFLLFPAQIIAERLPRKASSASDAPAG